MSAAEAIDRLSRFHAAAAAFLAAIEDVAFITRGPGGYDVEDAREVAANLADADLAAYRKAIERAAPDFARL